MAPDDLVTDPVGPLADEFVDRCRRGERPSVTEYIARYPELSDRIRQVFSMIVLMEKAGSQDGEASGDDEAPSAEKHAMPERIGGYRILREIGQGGMGVVYEAEQTALGRHVALKVLPVGAARKRERLERFQREARAAARLHHTNIVPVFEVGTAGDLCYYAMQYIHGQPLDMVLQELRSLQQDGGTPAGKPQPNGIVAERKAVALSLFAGHVSTLTQVASPDEPASELDFTVRSSSAVEGTPAPSPSSLTLTGSAAAPSGRSRRWHYYRSVAGVGIQVADALEYAHHEGVIHRDIKPSNLLLDTAGRVWITDFGLAYQPEAQSSGEKGLTQTGEIVGTIRYMPPERFRGWSDPRSDVYSLGLTLYEMLLLRPAYDAPDQVGLMQLVIQTEPDRPRKADPQIPRDLETIILKAIDKEPAQRYQSAADVAGDLKRFLEDRPILARPSSAVERTWRWCKRNRAVASFATAFVLALVLGLVGSTWQWWRAESHATELGLREQEVRKERDKVLEEHRQSLEAEAQALISSGLPGQRRKSIQALQEAARLRWSPRLRDLFISALSLADLQPGVEWDGRTEDFSFFVFDDPLKRYARSDRMGNISVRWIDGDREQVLLSGNVESMSVRRFSPDGRYLAGISYRASQPLLHVWDLDTRKMVLKDIPVSNPAFDFTPDSRGLVVLRSDRLICLYDLVRGELKKPLCKGREAIFLAIDPDGQRMALTGAFPFVEVRELSTGKVVATLPHDTPSGIGPVAWHPQNHDLLAAPTWGVHLWNVAKGELLAQVHDRAGLTTNVTFTHCGNFFATKGYGDSTIRLYDTWTGRALVQVPGSLSDIRVPLQFSTDDRLLACSIEERRIRLWRVELPTAYRSFGDVGKPGKGAYPFFDVSPSGKILAVAARSAEEVEAEGVAFWDLLGGRQAEFLRIGRTGAVIFHPRGDAFISASDSGVYHWPIRVDPKVPDVWRVGPPRRLLAGKSEHLSLSRDGRRLAVQSWNGLGTVFDLPDQDSLASWLFQESQHLVERLTGKKSRVQVSHAGLSQVALSPDGRWLATGTHNGKDVKVWNAQTGKLVKDLAAPGSATVSFSPDGKWLVTYCYPKYRIHETGSWELRHEIPNSSGSPIAFRADSRVLAVQLSGFKVQLLDPATGLARVFATLEPPDRDQSYATHLQFSPDGSELFACTSELRLIHGWNLHQLSEQLAALGQPWDLPPFDEAAARAGRPPLRENESSRPEPPGPISIVADLGEFTGFAEHRQSESAALAHRKSSQSALDASDWQKSLEEANLAVKEDPKNAEGYYLRGRGRLGLGRSPEARDDFTQALALNPNHAEAYHYRGHAAFGMGQYDKAVADFADALKRLPKDAHLYYMRGRARHHLLEYDKAIEDYQRVLELKPFATDEAGASEALAWLLVAGPERFRNADKALPLALRAHELQPEGYERLRTLGAVEYRLGQYEQAVKTLIRAAATAKPAPTAFDQLFLAMSYRRIGETVKARECYERAVDWRKKQTRLPEFSAELLNSLQSEAAAVLRP